MTRKECERKIGNEMREKIIWPAHIEPSESC